MNLVMSETATVFTQLTIRDGLVAQLPTLFLAIATGLVVRKSVSKEVRI